MNSARRLLVLAEYGSQRQRVPLELLPLEAQACRDGAAALETLAQTCGNCHHARWPLPFTVPGVVSCVPPVGPEVLDSAVHARFPFWGLRMPADERCKGWTKRENAQ